MKQELAAIQKARAEAEAKLKRLDAEKSETEQFLRDLIVTERTFARLLDVPMPPPMPPEPSPAKARKPSDIPSVFEMATTVIRDRGEEWVEGAEITAAIRRRWWPSATSNDITPTLWRLATKDKRLRKEGSLYALPIAATVDNVFIGAGGITARTDNVFAGLRSRAGVKDD